MGGFVGGGPPPPPPVVTSVTPNFGSTVGGTAINIHGTGFAAGAIAEINGVAATPVVWVSSILLTAVTGGYPTGGAADVVVQNPDLQDSGTSGNGAFTYIVPFDPTTLVLSKYQRGYAGVLPWDGTASAGTSGNYREIHGASDPTLGTINGVAAAQYTRTARNSNAAFLNNIPAVMEEFVTNPAYTVSLMVDIQGPGPASATPYLRSQFFSADAHWGWGCTGVAQMVGQRGLVFDAATQSITSTSGGSFIADGFTVGGDVYVRRTNSNNGTVSTPLSAVTATKLTFALGNIVDEVRALGDDVCVTQGPYLFWVFNYTGAFPAVSYPILPGVRWIYARRTASGTVQVDIDGVAGTPKALADHAGASGLQAQTDSLYPPNQIDYLMGEHFCSLASQSDAQRDNYARYLDLEFGTNYS